MTEETIDENKVTKTRLVKVTKESGKVSYRVYKRNKLIAIDTKLNSAEKTFNDQ